MLCLSLGASLFFTPGCSSKAEKTEKTAALSKKSVENTVNELLLRLKSPSPEMRVYAARKLAEIKEAAAPAIPLLIAMIPDIDQVEIKQQPEAGVVIVEKTTPRAEAFRTLVAIGRQAIQPLAAAASKSDGQLKGLAVAQGIDTDGVGWQKMLVEALGEIGPAAVDTLLMIMNDREGYHEYVRMQAAEALAKVKTPASLAPLIKALDDPSDGVRGSVAIALGELRDPGAVEPLFAVVLKKRGPYLPGGWTSERVEEALERITGKGRKDFNYSYQKWLAWWLGTRK